MRYRGLMTVCVLTFALVAVLAVSAVAQTTQPAETPADPVLVPLPDDNTTPPPPPPVARTTDSVTPAGDANATTAPSTTGSTQKKTNDQGPDIWLFGILLGGVVLMWLWMGRGRRKQQAQRKEMLSNLKKGDKITTIGGIIGTVIEAKPTEITVKVDETNNVRMKFTRGAIHNVGTDGKVGADDDSK